MEFIHAISQNIVSYNIYSNNITIFSKFYKFITFMKHNFAVRWQVVN